MKGSHGNTPAVHVTNGDGSREMNYTRPEFIDYEGQGFESCLFFAIPESF